MKLRRAGLPAQAGKGVKKLICKKCKKEYTPMKGDEGKGLCPKCLIEDLSNAAANPGDASDPTDKPITDTGVGQPTGSVPGAPTPKPTTPAGPTPPTPPPSTPTKPTTPPATPPKPPATPGVTIPGVEETPTEEKKEETPSGGTGGTTPPSTPPLA